MSAPPVILASGSAARTRMLTDAGVPFTVEHPRTDEAAAKAGLRAEAAELADSAVILADLKARSVARRHPDALVIGGDQVLDCGGDWLDKPADRAAARTQLQALRTAGTHRLISGAVIVRGTERLWQHVDSASLAVRPFTDAFLDDYLAAVGDAVLHSVGAYHLEGRGAQLFSRVRGDFFTVLGLPLLPLLDNLRQHGVLPQ